MTSRVGTCAMAIALAAPAALAFDEAAHVEAALRASESLQAQFFNGIGAPQIECVEQPGQFQIAVDRATTQHVFDPDEWACHEGPPILAGRNLALMGGLGVPAGVLLALEKAAFGSCLLAMACNYTHFKTNTTFRVFLIDHSCPAGAGSDTGPGTTYYSDHTSTSSNPSADHALVTGTNPSNVKIMDANLGCGNTSTNSVPTTIGNVEVTVTTGTPRPTGV